jgi:hypothetical protein
MIVLLRNETELPHASKDACLISVAEMGRSFSENAKKKQRG